MESLIISLSLLCSLLHAPQPKSVASFEPFALVELFTSQGCSSCPPADALLAETITDAEKNGKNIFALSFHVDYWNRLGWSDPFSDKSYSDRQSAYADAMQLRSIYTPQMVVNGTDELVGSNSSALNNALKTALNTTANIRFKKLEVVNIGGKPGRVDFELEGSFADCTVKVAVISLKETTQVKRGENGGRTLVNEHVVRQFYSIGATAAGHLDLDVNQQPESGNRELIAFIQNTQDLKITGAAAVLF